MSSVLVVGGTGPSGVHTVEGLIERGHDVVILHRGLHEAEFSEQVEHIHADPHFQESVEGALSGREFDTILCMYGRTRLVAEAAKGRTDRFLAISGVFYKDWVDGRLFQKGGVDADWEVEYRSGAQAVTEDHPTEVTGSFSERALNTEAGVMDAHYRGEFQGTILRFPQMYGPRQPAPLEWCLIRRCLDGRRTVIVPDGGLAVQTRLFSENAARGVLGAVDHPKAAAGQIFNIGDATSLTVRAWVKAVGAALSFEFDMHSVPYRDAFPAYPYALYPWNAAHKILDIGKAQSRLGYAPSDVDENMVSTVDWYSRNPLQRGGDDEGKLGDGFDYAKEDHLLSSLADASARIRELSHSGPQYVHNYDHPDAPKTT